MKHRFCIAALLLLFVSVLLCASEALAEGKKLLGERKAADAIPLLYQAVSEELDTKEKHAASNGCLYLGVAYSQLGKYTDAEQWFLKGKDLDIGDIHLYWYNLGNVYFLQKRFEDAEHAYTESLTASKNYAPAVLNRANTYMRRRNHGAALEDYKQYLNLAPDSRQKQAIQRLVLLLVEDEYIRQVLRIQEETRRLAVEADSIHKTSGAEISGGSGTGNAASGAVTAIGGTASDSDIDIIEGKRYDTLLKEINDALQSVDDAATLSAGSDNTLDYSEDYNLE